MTTPRHYRRLEQMYGPAAARSDAPRAVAVTHGRAHLRTAVGPAPEASDGPRGLLRPNATLHAQAQQLLADASALAAASLHKDRVVAAEQFSVRVVRPDYRGPVLANAEVQVVTPPRTTVMAVLTGAEGEVVAVATGVFAPTAERLPTPAELVEQPGASAAPHAGGALTPARFGAVAPTPFGPVHLN
jgi:hypothetical protein